MKIIASYGIKGGVGKTAASVNLAYAASAAGKNTLLIDLDPQGASSFYYKIKPAKKLKPKGFFNRVNKLQASIRGSDYERLDILPANLHYRNFDLMLNTLNKSKKRLQKILFQLKDDYELIILDCPPNIGLLSENIFTAADLILVPVIPTTLSERTFTQLLDFFHDAHYPHKKIHAFFSMVQANNRLHRTTMARMSDQNKRFFQQIIPLSVDIERMGMKREPVMAYAASRPAAQAYKILCNKVLNRLDLL